MNHLRRPLRPTHSIIRVPYVCTRAYPRCAFLEYPTHAGWSEAEIYNSETWVQREAVASHNDGTTAAKEDLLSFLQNWLFFGPLHIFFRDLFDQDDFFRIEQSGDRVLTTAKLHELEDTFLIEMKTSPKETSHLAEVDLCLHALHSRLSLIDARTTCDKRIMYSITLLGEFLTRVRNIWQTFQGPTPSPLSLAWTQRGRTLWEDSLLGLQMLQDGWCKSDILRAYLFTAEGTVFISNLDVPPSGRGHQACGRNRCVAHQIDEAAYKTQHVGHCDCAFVGVDMRLIVDLLSAKKVPIISVEGLSQNGLSVEISALGEVQAYVAISHVWSDGLGNNKENKLPACQLRRISDYVNGLYPQETSTVPFWIDTICCPLQPQSAQDTAIILMRDTYHKADKVLVLDQYLTRTHIDAGESRMTDYEMLVRISCSTWMRRLWTLQEGVLAPQLYFQFADRAVDFFDLYKAYRESNPFDDFRLYGLLEDIKGSWALASARKQSLNPFKDLVGLEFAVRDRSTSQPTDEALCLGTLFGIDMEELMKIPKYERMKAFWDLQGSVPSDIIFWGGPRLSMKGFGWAPATLMGQAYTLGSMNDVSPFPGFKSSVGLEVQYPGVVLGSAGARYPLSNKFWLRNSQQEWCYWIDLNPRDKPRDANRVIHAPYLPDHSNQDVCLIFRQPVSDLDPSGLNDARMIDIVLATAWMKSSGGVIFGHLGRTGRMYLARPESLSNEDWESAIQVRQWLESEMNATRVPPTGHDLSTVILRDRHYAVDGDWLPKNQRWCFD